MRTAIGAAFLSWVVIIFAVGSTDRLFFRLHISYTAQIHFWRVGVWVLPIIVFFATRSRLPLAAAKSARTRCAPGRARSSAGAPTARCRCSRRAPTSSRRCRPSSRWDMIESRPPISRGRFAASVGPGGPVRTDLMGLAALVGRVPLSACASAPSGGPWECVLPGVGLSKRGEVPGSPDFVTRRPLGKATGNEMWAIAPISLRVAGRPGRIVTKWGLVAGRRRG